MRSLPRRRRPAQLDRIALAGIGVGCLVLVAACTSAPGTRTPEGSPQPDPAQASEACVADPGAVVGALAQDRSADLPTDLVESMDAAVSAAFTDTGSSGAIVGVSNHEGTWIAAYGNAGRDVEEAMVPEAHTRVGSVSKTFTGTLIVQLEEEGLLSLDDTIDVYRQGVPNGDRITLRMLADMTSGIASYTFNEQFQSDLFGDPQRSFTAEELIEIGLADSPRFDPGEDFDYSNTNTVLLGTVAESVTGQTLAEALDERILGPLGLGGTSWPGTSTQMPVPFAHGSTTQGLDGSTEQDATHWNPSWGGAAGEIISTTADLLVFGHALATGQGLIDPGTAESRLHTFPEGEQIGYGVGFACYTGWVGHEGSMPGYNTQMVYSTRTNTTVVVIANSDAMRGACGDDERADTVLADSRCLTPASRILIPVSKVLGHEFTPPGG